MSGTTTGTLVAVFAAVTFGSVTLSTLGAKTDQPPISSAITW